MTGTVIIGYGFVGKATEYMLSHYTAANIEVYDPPLDKTNCDWNNAEYGFICVPTPEPANGTSLDLSAVTEAYELCLSNNITPVIRSTIGPDQVAQFPRAIMMPEFLREAHWEHDVIAIPHIILGNDTNNEIGTLFADGKQVIHTDAITAMMYKLARNAVLATKVIIANQLSEVCDHTGTDYDQLVSLLNIDNTIGLTHWAVPGPDGNAGFGGKCFPKDLLHMSSLCPDVGHNIFNHARILNRKFRKIHLNTYFNPVDNTQ